MNTHATLEAHHCMLLVIDMQNKLLPAIHDAEALRGRAARIAQAARLLEVPVWATEHWPDKIGPTHADLAPHIDHIVAKTHFDACREPGFTDELPRHRDRVLLMGTEAHICVLQTGLGLAAAGLRPALLADGIGSRRESDRLAACERWRHHGLEILTSEMALFEWLRTPAHPRFRDVLALVKSS
ncbi:isochorismatase family protein [Castellaniella sp. GW247-6E4]|uniref:isochorismatase family protein n=1 Tax=Castellaniella sp. GW247-6E4 TaxID=3140380 RepID=UPI003315A4F1